MTVTKDLTSYDMKQLDVMDDLYSVSIASSSQYRLKLCYKTLTNGFVDRLLHPSNARVLAFIVSSPYYKDLLTRAVEFALTETERLENEWTGFMGYEDFGLKSPVRSGELAQNTADLVRLLAKLRVGYVKYGLLKQYRAWEKEVRALAAAQAKADAIRLPVPGALSVITVR